VLFRSKVFITLTEYGREFFTDFEDEIAPGVFEKYKKCNRAVDIAQALGDQVAEILNIDSMVELETGINYVSNLYPDSLRVLPRSWLEVIKNQPMTEFCAVVGSWVISKYKNLKEVNPNTNQLQLLEDMEQMIVQADRRLDIIFNTGYNHKVGYGHPTSQGHNLWAKYIMNNITF
jgi:hypothetical protein